MNYRDSSKHQNLGIIDQRGPLLSASHSRYPLLQGDNLLAAPQALLNGHRHSAAHKGASREGTIAIETCEASLIQVEVASGGIHCHSMDLALYAGTVGVRDLHTLPAGTFVGCGPWSSDQCGVVSEDIDKLGVLRVIRVNREWRRGSNKIYELDIHFRAQCHFCRRHNRSPRC